MRNIIIEDSGKIRNIEDVEVVEKIIEMRKHKDPWIVIDALVDLWAQKAPDDEEAIKVNIRQYKESQYDRVYAQTQNGRDFERRFIMAFPKSLMLLIRTQYKVEELPFDRAFYTKFAERYPAFKVAEKT